MSKPVSKSVCCALMATLRRYATAPIREQLLRATLGPSVNSGEWIYVLPVTNYFNGVLSQAFFEYLSNDSVALFRSCDCENISLRYYLTSDYLVIYFVDEGLLI